MSHCPHGYPNGGGCRTCEASLPSGACIALVILLMLAAAVAASWAVLEAASP